MGRRLTAFAAVLSTVLATATVVVLPVGTAAAQPDPLASLRAAIAGDLSHASASQVAARVDVEGTGRFGISSTALLPPASNQKIFTAVTALARLGGDFRYVTSVWTDAPRVNATGVVDGVLPGNLVLRASGDPSLRRADLDGLAVVLSRLGVRTVTGALYVDDSRYDHDTVAPGWKADFVPDEVAPVAAFTVDRNEWRRDAAYLRNPVPANAGAWRDLLAHRGITVVGPTRIGSPPVLTSQLATHGSAPFSSLVTHMLRASDNFYAEMMLREAGAALTGHGSRRSGIYAIGVQAHSLNVPLGGVYDGSGLSYSNREAPTQVVSWLHAAAGSPIGSVLRSALPRSCFDGTLSDRLCGPWLTGRIHAKTGTLTAVRALSGFTATPDGRQVVFSVLLSGIHDMTVARQQLDRAVARLARFTG